MKLLKKLEKAKSDEEARDILKNHVSQSKYNKYKLAYLTATARWRAKNPNYQRDYIRKRRQQVKELIGTQCVVCGATQKICFHEINGNDHPRGQACSYILKNYKNFVPLCKSDHSLIHAIAHVENPEKIIDLIRQIIAHHQKF